MDRLFSRADSNALISLPGFERVGRGKCEGFACCQVIPGLTKEEGPRISVTNESLPIFRREKARAVVLAEFRESEENAALRCLIMIR